MTVRVILDPPVKGPRDPLRWVRRILLLFAVGALGVSSYVYLDAALYQAREDKLLDEGPPSGSAATSQATSRPSVGETLPDGISRRSGDTVFEPSLIGRIAIPRLNVRAIVKEGVDSRTLRRAVGHIPGTALPGETGNVAFAGHRDSFFRGLRDVRKNDHIRVETFDRAYEYVVDSLKIVNPKDVQVLAPTDDAVLTLVTCYPFQYVGNAPKRFIVRARQVAVTPRDTPGS